MVEKRDPRDPADGRASAGSFQLGDFLRALFLILSAAGLTAFLGPPALAAMLADRSGRIFSLLQRAWFRGLLWANGIHVHRRGLENLEKGRGYLVISNHASLLDIPGIAAALPFPIRFIAKRSIFFLPIFGWAMCLSGHIPIDRRQPQSALRSMQQAAWLMERGISVVVFAEGTRSPNGEVKDFKRGAFLLALQLQATILPVSISGTFSMLPRTGWYFRPGTIRVHIGRPILTRGLGRNDLQPLMAEARARIVRGLDPSPPA